MIQPSSFQMMNRLLTGKLLSEIICGLSRMGKFRTSIPMAICSITPWLLVYRTHYGEESTIPVPVFSSVEPEKRQINIIPHIELGTEALANELSTLGELSRQLSDAMSGIDLTDYEPTDKWFETHYKDLEAMPISSITEIASQIFGKLRTLSSHIFIELIAK